MTVCRDIELVDIQPWEMVFRDTSRIKLMQCELFRSFLKHFQLPENILHSYKLNAVVCSLFW